MIKVVLDNIIFSLQRSGGISVVWSELLKRLQLGNLNFECLEYDVMSNINRRQLNLNSKSVQVRKKRFLSISRYFSPRVVKNEKIILSNTTLIICI